MDREPVLLWKHFEAISRIPRGSGNEAGVRAYIRDYAAIHGFEFQEDAAGNCLVSVPGRGGTAKVPTVVLQSHMDMVCVKDEGLAHDFTRDPIQLRQVSWKENSRTTEVLMATGTTLGADNGIGLAAILAVAVDPAVVDCPPLDLLCTVDEETGLTGARHLDPALLRADLLINLDSEEIGEICISCAGGRDLNAEWTVQRSAPSPEEIPVRLTLSGLPGGHSGVQIHERRGNAILMLLYTLLNLSDKEGLKLAAFSGGTARNVIPGDAEIVVWAPEALAGALIAAFQDPALLAQIRSAVIPEAADRIACGCERIPHDGVPGPLSTVQTETLLDAIAAIPNGVQNWSEMVEGLVETSNNVAVISTTEETIHLQCSTRSSRDGAIAAFQEKVKQKLEHSGATVTFSDGYPGWPADPNNPLLARAKQTFETVLGNTPKVMAVHAGLECGVFKGKRPTLQMISFGPNIRDAHTTQERIELASVPPFYACLTTLLHDLARG